MDREQLLARLPLKNFVGGIGLRLSAQQNPFSFPRQAGLGITGTKAFPLPLGAAPVPAR